MRMRELRLAIEQPDCLVNPIELTRGLEMWHSARNESSNSSDRSGVDSRVWQFTVLEIFYRQSLR
jgi:hypothetical protein